MSDCPAAIDPPAEYVQWYQSCSSSPIIDVYIDKISNQQQEMLRNRQVQKVRPSLDKQGLVQFLAAGWVAIKNLLPEISFKW